MARYFQNGAVVREFADAMFVLAEACQAKLTERTVRVYAQLLDDVPLEQLVVAFRKAAEESRYPVVPSVGVIKGFLRPSAEDRAVLAWSSFERAASRVGAYASVDVADGCAAKALIDAFGSWAAFCESEDGPQLALKRQAFLAAYRQAVRLGTPSMRLRGICEQQNTALAEKEIAGTTVVASLALDGTIEIRNESVKKLSGVVDAVRALPEGTIEIQAEEVEQALGIEGCD